MGIIIHFISQSYFGIFWRFDLTFRYISMYLVFSVLGTFHDQKFFLIYILFYFMEHETLSNIFNAIIFNIKQLLSVSMLGVVFVYVFCIIFFETYSLDMMSAESDDTCVGILGCIMDLYVSYTISGSVE